METKVQPDETPHQDGHPLVEMMYDFFCEPLTSLYGTRWGIFTAWLVVGHLIVICLETCDGPNKYNGRPNMARFKFLLTTNQYGTVEEAIMIPLALESAFRLVMLALIYIPKDNAPIRKRLKADTFVIFLLVCDILGVIPFTIQYFGFLSIKSGTNIALTFQMMTLLLTGRILRITKDLGPIWAIRVALIRSSVHLVVPIFFFVVFNITAAVFFYFAEPCFNINVCPWDDLFGASFFSAVTMTTSEPIKQHIFFYLLSFISTKLAANATYAFYLFAIHHSVPLPSLFLAAGYGNQVPMYEFGRFGACCAMLFGMNIFIC